MGSKYDPDSLVLVGRMPGETRNRAKARRRKLAGKVRRKRARRTPTPPTTAEVWEALARICERVWRAAVDGHRVTP